MKSTPRWLKRTLFILMIVFLLMNVIAAFHAYNFTHFSLTATERSARPEQLSFTQKLSALATGVKTPKPSSSVTPALPYSSVIISSNPEIAAWYIPADDSRGTIAIFHGYMGEKGKMLDKAELFHAMGYSTLLVDFIGSGESEGVQTTIGYYEAEQVIAAMNYLEEKGESTIYLFGTSMGAAAIMKAMADTDISPTGVILECPFGSLYKTVCARFDAMGVPVFPMASLLVFWGGIENSYWGFSHNPQEYAKSMNVPVLLMYGAKDARVSKEETELIYTNLPGEKELVIFPDAGHENYLNKYKTEWIASISKFLMVSEPKVTVPQRAFEYLPVDSMLVNGAIKFQSSIGILTKNLGMPDSSSTTLFECGHYVGLEEPDSVSVMHINGSRFIVKDQMSQISEIDFDKQDIVVAFPELELNSETTLSDLDRKYPKATEKPHEWLYHERTYSTVQLNTQQSGSDDSWLLLFLEGRLAKLIYFVPC